MAGKIPERLLREFREALEELAGPVAPEASIEEWADGTVRVSLPGPGWVEALADLLAPSGVVREAPGATVAVAADDFWRVVRHLQLALPGHQAQRAMVAQGRLEPLPGPSGFRATVPSVAPPRWAELSQGERTRLMAEVEAARARTEAWAEELERITPEELERIRTLFRAGRSADE
jgi:hypothetical protein